MSQISTFETEVFESAASAGTITYTPVKLRDGLATLSGVEEETTIFDNGGQISATVSVRAGKAADLINGTQRVKRKFILRGRLPVTVVGLTAGGDVGDVIDYIDIDFTIASPVEATSDQLLSAVSFGNKDNGPLGSTWVEDMLINGYEPY
jgi:hypothetical protein